MYDEKVETLKVFSCGVTAFVYKALGGERKDIHNTLYLNAC